MSFSSRILRASGCVTLSLLCSGAASAQDAGVLASVTRIKCQFTLMVTGTWKKDGTPQAEVKPVTFALAFDSINTDENTARAVGTFGPSDIIVRLSRGNLHFIQAFREGAIYTTTIFPKETHDGRLRAVHTRHEFTEVSVPGFTSTPESYYGDCEVQQ